MSPRGIIHKSDASGWGSAWLQHIPDGQGIPGLALDLVGIGYLNTEHIHDIRANLPRLRSALSVSSSKDVLESSFLRCVELWWIGLSTEEPLEHILNSR